MTDLFSELIHIEYLNSVMKTTEDTLSKVPFISLFYHQSLIGRVQHGNIFRKTYEKGDKRTSQRVSRGNTLS
jgi:hypothetical protein